MGILYRQLKLAFGGAILATICAIGGANAATVYTFTGLNYSTFSTFQSPAYAVPVGADDPAIPGAYTNAIGIGGSFTVASTLAASAGLVDVSGSLLDFSFNDGRNPTLTLANTGNLADFRVQADAAGNIVNWVIVLQPKAFSLHATNEQGYTIQSTASGDLGVTFVCTGNFGGGCIQWIQETAQAGAGSWAQISVSPVPLPAAMPLYGAGLAILGFIGWRRKRRTAALPA